jgi:peptidyl-prolyl cis-trans isomerase C
MLAPPIRKAHVRSARAVAAALGLVAVAACARHDAPGRPPEPGDKAVAVVADQTIWASDVKRQAVERGLIGEGEPLDVSSQTFHEVLDEVIDQKLLANEAMRRRLENDPQVKRRLAAARERILGDALIEAETERAASDSAIRSLYDEQVRLSKQTDEVHAQQIVTANQADADAARKQVAGGAAFDAVAMQRSIDAATRFNGGDLGYVALDAMPQAYAAALANAKPGDLVGPFRTDAGWVVLKLDDRRPEKPLSMEEARPQIVRFLNFTEVRDMIEHLRQKTPPRLLIGPAEDVPGAPHEPASAPPEPAASATPVAAAAAVVANPPEKTP